MVGVDLKVLGDELAVVDALRALAELEAIGARAEDLAVAVDDHDAVAGDPAVLLVRRFLIAVDDAVLIGAVQPFLILHDQHAAGLDHDEAAVHHPAGHDQHAAFLDRNGGVLPDDDGAVEVHDLPVLHPGVGLDKADEVRLAVEHAEFKVRHPVRLRVAPVTIVDAHGLECLGAFLGYFRAKKCRQRLIKIHRLPLEVVAHPHLRPVPDAAVHKILRGLPPFVHDGGRPILHIPRGGAVGSDAVLPIVRLHEGPCPVTQIDLFFAAVVRHIGGDRLAHGQIVAGVDEVFHIHRAGVEKPVQAVIVAAFTAGIVVEMQLAEQPLVRAPAELETVPAALGGHHVEIGGNVHAGRHAVLLEGLRDVQRAEQGVAVLFVVAHFGDISRGQAAVVLCLMRLVVVVVVVIQRIRILDGEQLADVVVAVLDFIHARRNGRVKVILVVPHDEERELLAESGALRLAAV